MNATSSVDIATTLLAAQQDMRSEQIGFAMIRKQSEQQATLIAMIDASAQAPAPAPGTGTLVDRQA